MSSRRSSRKRNGRRLRPSPNRSPNSMAADSPERFVSTIPKAKRHGKILIDYLRNQRGMTAVAPYSTRARPGAPVSMPLAWQELAPEIGSAYFTIRNAPSRLSSSPIPGLISAPPRRRSRKSARRGSRLESGEGAAQGGAAEDAASSRRPNTEERGRSRREMGVLRTPNGRASRTMLQRPPAESHPRLERPSRRACGAPRGREAG